MKRRLLTFALAMFLLSAAAFGAPTGTVTVSGAVPIVCDITVTTLAGATNIADISAGDTDRPIATVNENCNDPDGYIVAVVGTNSGDHTGTFIDSVSADSHGFTIAYDGNAVAAGGIVTDENAPGINLDKDVAITYPANAALTATSAFTYTETLTFTITAK